MPHRTIPSIFAIVAASALAVSTISAAGADLPAQSRLGAVFAEPAEVRAGVRAVPEYETPIIAYNLWPDFAWSRGGYYYGSRYSYIDTGPYYGGPYASEGLRLPYACGLYGYC
jgi:hypothetical protein